MDGRRCGGCRKAKAYLKLVGGEEVKNLYDHVGHVVEEDTFETALEKIKAGIKRQTNQATARFKLFQQMPQSGGIFGDWAFKIKEQSDRCLWVNYDSKMAARDAILFQTDDKRLQRKIIAEDLNYDDTVRFGLAMEQGAKKVEEINKGAAKKDDPDRVAALEEQVRALTAKSKVKTGSFNGSGRKKLNSFLICKTCTRPTHGEGKCPGLNIECYDCKKKGHFKGSEACKNKTKPSKNVKTRAVNESEDETDSEVESVGRVKVEKLDEDVRAVPGDKSRQAKLKLTALDSGRPSLETNIELVIDSGVSKTLISEEDWRKVKQKKGQPMMRLKRSKVNFSPFGTNIKLPILGRTKCKMVAVGGAEITTIVYVVEGETTSLLGLKDGESLGIINIKPEGKTEEVRQLNMEVKKDVPNQGMVSGGQTQEEIDIQMEEITKKYKDVFKGLGRAKVEPIHIEIDPNVKPVQQKRRPIALHYQEKFRKHIEELKAQGTVDGPLDSSHAMGWISNPVIRAKSWDSEEIRVTLDTRPMNEAVKTSHFPIPTPEELRHAFSGSNRYSILDLNHCFHQFEMSDSSKSLFVFNTSFGLYRFNTLVMGVSSASSECHERMRKIVEGLEGVQQIKDDIVVHGAGVEHDRRLEKLLKRLQEYNLTLRKRKCQFGVSQVRWFGNIYSEQGMSPDPDKVKMIKAWPRPEDKAGVKSFLQTVQFCQVFMRPGDGRTYSDVTKPLRCLTAKNVQFKWNKKCEESFQELKELLSSDKVMANYDPKKPTRLYVDEGPEGVAATVAQSHKVEGLDQEVWRPVHHNSRAKTECEANYGKVDGESLGVLSGILSNRMYLYGTPFVVVVDHQPLVSLYSSHSRDLPVRVAKHRSKLRGFNFKVKYEPGITTPADYGSRNPPPKKIYSEEEKEDLGVEEENEDAEIIVNHVEELTDAVTLPILTNETENDEELKKLKDDIRKGRLRPELKIFKEMFPEMSLNQGVILKGERLLIPASLRPDVLGAAHEGHPGRESMLRQLRLSVWWPGMGQDVREFVESCLPCGAAVGRNSPAPMIVRETPERPWQHCAADFKGPIGGQYYFHVLIDLYSRWPEVQMTKSTSFEKLRPALEESFSLHGIPESITHDQGPPYNSGDWQRYAKEVGFESRPCTPEHPEANGVAERFMGVLVKTVHTAVAEGRDPRVEVKRRLLNYRTTPHPSTGKAPCELMNNRMIRSKVPRLLIPAQSKVHKEAQEKDKETREKRKENYDKKKRAKDKEYKLGDKVLISQKKTTINPPFDPKPFQVTKVKGTQVTAERGNKVRVRNQGKMKVIPERPKHLMQKRKVATFEDTTDDDDDYITLQPTIQEPVHADARVEEFQPWEDLNPAPDFEGLEVLNLEAQEFALEQQGKQDQEEEQEPRTPEPRRPRRERRSPDRYSPDWLGRSQLSPKERKKRMCAAKYKK